MILNKPLSAPAWTLTALQKKATDAITAMHDFYAQAQTDSFDLLTRFKTIRDYADELCESVAADMEAQGDNREIL